MNVKSLNKVRSFSDSHAIRKWLHNSLLRHDGELANQKTYEPEFNNEKTSPNCERKKPQIQSRESHARNFFISYLFYVITLGFKCDTSEVEKETELMRKNYNNIASLLEKHKKEKCNNGGKI
jgi:hypothetical protein